MSEVRARDAAIRRELGVPPTFDLVAHVRNLGRVLLPALVIGLLVSGALYLVRGSATPVYESNIVAEVQAGSQVVITDANLGQLVAPYVALATDNVVVADIQAQMGDAWIGVPVSAFMAVTPGTTPSLLFVKATGYSQLEADKLGRVIVKTLDDAQTKRNAETLVRRTKTLNDEIARLNTELSDARQESLDNDETPVEDKAVRADLDAKLEQLRQLTTEQSSGDRLELLSAPAGSGLPVAPKPFVESAVAFLAVTILAAEILAACRGRFGTRMTDAWARRAAKKYGTSLLLQHSPAAEMPPNVALTVTQRASLGDHVLVLFGDGVAMDSWAVPEGLRSRISQCSLSSDWWSKIDANAVDFALVVVSALDADQKDVTDCLRALAEVDVTRTLVLVGPAVSESLIASVRSRLGGTDSVRSAPRPKAEGRVDSWKKVEGSGQPDPSGAAGSAEDSGPPPAPVELDGRSERAQLNRAADAPSAVSLDSMDRKMRDVRNRDVGNREIGNPTVSAGNDRRRPHTVDGQAWRRSPADRGGSGNPAAGVAPSSGPFDVVDRRARRDLIDPTTVSIDRSRLPKADGDAKRTAEGAESSSDSDDRRDREDLIDSATVSIDRNHLPVAEPDGKSTTAEKDAAEKDAAEKDNETKGETKKVDESPSPVKVVGESGSSVVKVDESRSAVMKVDSRSPVKVVDESGSAVTKEDDSASSEQAAITGSGVDVASGGDINSEVRTERIMLTTRDIAEARDRRAASRVNLARTERKASASKN